MSFRLILTSCVLWLACACGPKPQAPEASVQESPFVGCGWAESTSETRIELRCEGRIVFVRILLVSKASMEDHLSGLLLGLKAAGAGALEQTPLRIDGLPSNSEAIRLEGSEILIFALLSGEGEVQFLNQCFSPKTATGTERCERMLRAAAADELPPLPEQFKGLPQRIGSHELSIPEGCTQTGFSLKCGRSALDVKPRKGARDHSIFMGEFFGPMTQFLADEFGAAPEDATCLFHGEETLGCKVMTTSDPITSRLYVLYFVSEEGGYLISCATEASDTSQLCEANGIEVLPGDVSSPQD